MRNYLLGILTALVLLQLLGFSTLPKTAFGIIVAIIVVQWSIMQYLRNLAKGK